MAAAILMYHRVAALEPDTFALCTTPAVFRDQMEQLARAHRVVPLDALAAGDDALALTFDDVSLDALAAARELTRLGLPATFFVMSGGLDAPLEAWWDVLERLFIGEGELPALLPWAGAPLPCVSPAERSQAHRLVRERLLPLGSTERDAYVDELLGWSGRALAPRDTHRLLLRREVVELSRIPGCTIGAHSVSHPWLPRRPVQEQQSELERCRADLEGLIARPVDGFAYPFGAHDEQTVSLVRQAGYRLAVTTEARSLGSSDSPLRLPRLPAPRQAGNEFSRFLAGVLA